ncbi:MAG TPA: ABC transporter permease [Bacteroidales bacterium]|nr:ABC transporter permease [Bacteroidales bacterium]HRX97695.1 ABC transporter permease [Bacteroidales bacterium]
MERYLQIINIALEAVFANRFRSILTALGIIFGVAAVIAMMAIGNGAQKEILDQMKLIGVNNIIITPVIDNQGTSSSDDDEGKSQTKKFSPGLTLSDALGIKEILPTVDKVSPEVIYETHIIKDGIRSSATLNGVTPDFFDVFNLTIAKGTMFTEDQMMKGNSVCIIGPKIASKFFPNEDPIGSYIKCGSLWLKVVGVLEGLNISGTNTDELGISNYNVNIYAPIQTILLRYKDRAAVTAAAIHGSGEESIFIFDGGMSSFSSSSSGSDDANYHQIDKIVVQVKESSQLVGTEKVVKEMLMRRHQNVEDFSTKIPELILKSEQRTKDLFRAVLVAIASISLIVGGIGIMNIMLASVMERIREIGVRMATGARKKDIVVQYLSEATLISITGGLIGIILGIALSKIIMMFFEITTIVSPISIFVSFGVSVAVGIIFGYMPAKRASEQDPVESLRHD